MAVVSESDRKELTFTLSAGGGVAPWTWIDHPVGTVGYFVDAKTGIPSNGFYLVPGMDRQGELLQIMRDIPN